MSQKRRGRKSGDGVLCGPVIARSLARALAAGRARRRIAAVVSALIGAMIGSADEEQSALYREESGAMIGCMYWVGIVIGVAGALYLAWWLFMIGTAVADAWGMSGRATAWSGGAIVGVVVLSLVLGKTLGAFDRHTPPPPPPTADQRFCQTHVCIPSFYGGSGYVVQCADGEWSHSGGLSGACSYHGGVG